MRMHLDELEIDERLVRHLLSTQLPHLADQRLTKVEPWGTDNAVWRLGEDFVVRLPRIHWASGQVDFENTWLPHLASFLPVAVPDPIALGLPDDRYPWRWGVYQWLPGDAAGPSTIDDPNRFAIDLADVVRALGRIPTDGAPEASNRARPLQAYNKEALAIIQWVKNLIDADAARAVWE
jgi:aminoglycoside phosphotransferase (APT) family kinase protein